jgi:hypothetical protein
MASRSSFSFGSWDINVRSISSTAWERLRQFTVGAAGVPGEQMNAFEIWVHPHVGSAATRAH